MRRAILSLAVALILSSTVAYAAATTISTSARPPLIVTSQNHALVDADDCQHFHTRTLTSLPALVHSEEKRNVQLGPGLQLSVRTGTEGGVSVRGWDRSYARLTVCKSAVALTEHQAKDALSDVNVAVRQSEIVAEGPAFNQTQTWWVNMILWVPRAAKLDVTAANGGIAIRNMSGQVTARATNGGISIASCAGENDLQTKNGGISIDKVSGRVRAVTEGGAISLKLRDLTLPALEAITDDQGEIYCNVKGCADGIGQWAADRKKLRIGGDAAPSIRLTSYSADIMIEQVR